jgi:hypothetical protein
MTEDKNPPDPLYQRGKLKKGEESISRMLSLDAGIYFAYNHAQIKMDFRMLRL